MDEPVPPQAATTPRYAAGWYPDPTGRYEVRYHNGSIWTGDVAVDGRRSVDPLGLAPSHRRNGAAVASLVLGICAVVVGWMPWIVVAGAACCVAALVTGVIGLRRSAHGGRRSAAVAGLVLGGLAVPVVAVGVLTTRIAMSLLDPAPYSVSGPECSWTAGRATLEATITNTGDVDSGYLVYVRFFRPGSSSNLQESFVQVDDVPAGGSRTFSAAFTTDVEDVDCDVVEVFGDIPFDID